jgi:hypothetical protein
VPCPRDLAEFGVSAAFWKDLPLLGVDLVIVGRRPRTVTGGTIISEGVMASAQGLFDGSSIATCLPVLLSLRLSRMLFGSPLTACALASPDETDPEFELDSGVELIVIFVVSICSPRLGDLLLGSASSSTHPAGVGGTGPRLDIGAAAGRRVGGEITGSGVLVML